LLAAGEAPAQLKAQSKGDPRVRKVLNEAGLKFTEDKDGDFRLTFHFQEDNRTQGCIVASKTYELGIFEIREIWATAWRGKEPPSAEVANRLLLDNARGKLGAWELLSNDREYRLVFVLKVSADCSAAELKTALRTVSMVSDEMEKELTHADEF